MKKIVLTEDQKRQLEALAALPDEEIDLSDIPDQSGKTGWVLRLAAPDVMRNR